jgi:hypothetical protein
VCADCHARIEGAQEVRLTTTGEFNAVGYEVMTAPGRATPVAPPAASDATTRCDWCGKPRSEVKKLLTGGTSHICNECVALCADILVAELGDGWR